MEVDIQIRGITGVLTIGWRKEPGAHQLTLWWELRSTTENVGGNWIWKFGPAMGGSRWAMQLLSEGRHFASLTSGRFGPSAQATHGAVPNQPWFGAADVGNGQPVDGSPSGPRRLMSSFSWSVAAIRQ